MRRRLASLVGMGIAIGATPLLACPICFQVEQGPVTNGIRAAVIVLITVTSMVLTGFAVFISRFVQRASAEPENENPETSEPRNRETIAT